VESAPEELPGDSITSRGEGIEIFLSSPLIHAFFCNHPVSDQIRNVNTKGNFMATYVLVHGGNMSTETWNKLTVGKPVCTKDGHMGAMYWDGTVSALRAQDHRVFAPGLKDEHTSTLTGHIDQISALLDDNDLKDVILVGHSYGGMVITGVAARMPERIRRLVYLDAALPDPGQSLYDLLTLGLSTASGKGPVLPEPYPPYREKIQFDPVKIQALPKTYILCTKSEFADITHIAREKIAKRNTGWTILELPSSHVPMADMPDRFYQLLLDIAKEQR
jgi:pimeloyl-ACP methyl ester carboxylesterase